MAETLRALIVEDSEEDTLLLAHELKMGGYDLLYERVDTPEGMAEALKNRPWDIIVSDYVMPRFSGLNALKLKQEMMPDLPFIIVSGQIGEDVAVEAMKAGAQDYIMKGHLAKLVPTVERELREAGMRREKKEAEAKLLQYAKDWEMTFDSMSDGVSIHSPDFTILNINKSLSDILGKKRDELIGKKCFEIFHGKDNPIAGCPLEKTKVSRRKEYADIFEPALNAWLSVSTAPVLNEDGELYYVVHVVRDITEKKRAEETIIKSRDFYLKLFEEFPNLIWRSGVDAKCNYFNKGWLNFTGRTIEQEMGDGWAEGVHPDDLSRCVKIYLEEFEKREPFEMEYRLRHHTGEHRWIVDYGRPFYDLEGKFAGYIGSCFDINERKIAGEKVKEQLEELQRWMSATVGREIRMKEIRDENERLKALVEELEKR